MGREAQRCIGNVVSRYIAGLKRSARQNITFATLLVSVLDQPNCSVMLVSHGAPVTLTDLVAIAVEIRDVLQFDRNGEENETDSLPEGLRTYFFMKKPSQR